MQFHEYATLRNHWAKQSHDPKMRARAESMKSEDFRTFILGSSPALLDSDSLSSWARTQIESQMSIAFSEQTWVYADRPFYNVWPIAVSLAQDLRLDLPFTAVEIPFNALLLRFAMGHEPLSVGTAMVGWLREERVFHLHCWFAHSADTLSIQLDGYKPDESVEDWLTKAMRGKFEEHWVDGERRPNFAPAEASELMLRLVVFVGLLVNDEDMITPVVLSKDRAKYESTDDPTVKKWLEDRAARRGLARGFDVGKKLQQEKDKSPHWRNPHLCLFWTGTGRKKPVIQMRSGGVVQRVSMADVPTGYLGPETEADDIVPPTKTPRESISKPRRFEILKRDGYRCQLCGKSADDGVILHVDHRVPLAKGGSNENENLWTLCEECNLGKSDIPL